jgi:hypothetical protein
MKKKRREVGIPGDRYRVELRGLSYYVIDAATGGIMGGPWGSRDPAQQRADLLNVTFRRRSV